MRRRSNTLKENSRATRAETWHQVAFFVFQSLTVVAAAAATVMAVADPTSVAPEYRAIPAAIATLGASVLAAFQFRGAWRRHVTAARNLRYELLKFKNTLREYRPTAKREPTGVDLFLSRVEAISRAGHQEPEQESVPPEPEPETQLPDAKQPPRNLPPGR
jgi:hypothetical protein